MTIRLATPQDAPSIARIHVDSWRTTYAGLIPQHVLDGLSYKARESYWQRALSNPGNPSFIYVAEDAPGEIAGFACGGPSRAEELPYKGELYAIYILEERQGKGIGRGLFLAIVERLAEIGIRSMLLWVLAGNPACGFYEAIGGRKVAERQEEMGGEKVMELAYAWDDTSGLLTQGED